MSFQPVLEKRLDGAAPAAARSLTSGSGAVVTDYAFADAEDAVRRALARRFPNDTFRLTALQDSHVSRMAWAFRCKKKGENSSLVCKAGAPTVAGRARLATEFRLLRGYRAALGDGHDTVPEALHFDRETAVLFTGDAKGRTAKEHLFRATCAADVKRVLKRSGSWLRLFHALSAASVPFDPTPVDTWLAGLQRQHVAGTRAILDYSEFATACDQLRALSAQARGRAATTCVTHRDFNTGNILFRGSGQAFGLDFHNEDREPALRDALFFVEDAFVQVARAERLEKPVRKLWGWFMAGYGPGIEDDAIIRYFQMSFALSTWAKIGHARVPTTNDRLRLRFAKGLALEVAKGQAQDDQNGGVS